MYLKVDKNFHRSNNPHNWKQGCEFCKKPFELEERFVRVDVQTGIFRGDDDVYCFHKECRKRGLRKLGLTTSKKD